MRLLTILIMSLGMSLSACTTSNPTPIPAQPSTTPTQAPPTAEPTDTPTPIPSPTATPSLPGYTSLQRDLATIADTHHAADGIDLGIAFVDLTTGKRVDVRGDERFYSLSTFKAPLAVYYLWLLEQGQLTEQPTDGGYITPMLSRSSNTDTSCLIERVGGLPGFNDWLAEQGLPREENFVIAWQGWACPLTGHIPEPDLRYTNGDAALGLPNGDVIRQCPEVRCDKAFAPNDLARFYQRLHAGDVISAANVERWLEWMRKPPEDTAFDDTLTGSLPMTAYTKEGFRPVDPFFGQNFYHETGIVSTPRGDYVLLIFMQNNPEWPGEALISTVAATVHHAFEANHP